MINTSKKFIVITGANKGIGLQIVKDLLKHKDNYNLILTSRDIKRGQEAIKSIESTQNVNGRLYYEPLDIESEESISQFIETVKTKYTSIHSHVNNAAVCLEPCKSFEDFFSVKIDEKTTKSTINTNLKGTISLTEKILPYLEDKGKIFFISSIAGQSQFQGEAVKKLHFDSDITPEKYGELVKEFEETAIKQEHTKIGYHNSVYFDTKFFLNTYAREIVKHRMKDGQRAYVIHPGLTNTDMGNAFFAPVEMATISLMKAFNYNEEEAEKNNFKFHDEKGSVIDY